ncbi:unknown protein [Cronobacter turicensis z3032]|uniref:Uncharacterized protein n=1 Tax=Cronobacter turicensis (strain DSM 18703 / CCUG 55852 / LMG 23827 / z3032) TaxID=693216 RepID=C9Y3R4_CROTZ|nr:unknown protein [Cronobacter turicensis z3032]
MIPHRLVCCVIIGEICDLFLLLAFRFNEARKMPAENSARSAAH